MEVINGKVMQEIPLEVLLAKIEVLIARKAEVETKYQEDINSINSEAATLQDVITQLEA